MGAIFLFTLFCALEYQCLLEGIFICILCSVFLADVQGMPLDFLTLVSGVAAFLGPMELWQSEGCFLEGYHPTGHCIDRKLRHTPSLSVKDATSLSWSLIIRDRFQVWHTFSGL